MVGELYLRMYKDFWLYAWMYLVIEYGVHCKKYYQIVEKEMWGCFLGDIFGLKAPNLYDP